MLKRLSASNRSLAILCTVLFLTFLDNTIVSIILSNIQTSLSAGVQDLQWVVDAYMLVFAVFMLTGGTLGDIFGRKKVLLGGVGLFAAGSVMASLAHSVDLLVAGRAVMGLGAAASEPGTLSMIRHLYPERSPRARALGVWAAVSGIALAFGPIIGGVIIGFASWRWVFGLGGILSLLILAVGWVFLPESADPKGRHIDYWGLITGGSAISAIIFALIVGETGGYGSWWIALLFALSFVAAIAFIVVERRQADPVLPLGYFKKLEFSVANIVAFATNFGIFAVFFFVALYLQLLAGFSGYQIALAFLAMTAAIVGGSLLAGRWNAKRQPLPLFIAGSAAAGGGIFLLNHVLNPHIGSATLAWVLAISGFGFGICLVTMTSSVLNIVSPERSGMAASTVNTFRELGGVFGVAVLGSILNGRLTGQLLQQLRALHLPANFQQFVIYAITHGGNTPKGVNVSPAILAQHAQLVAQVTNAAYQAFGSGLKVALNIAGGMLLATAAGCAIAYRQRRATPVNS